MAKQKTLYACRECGGQALKWQGQCPHCQAWNTLEETFSEAAPSANRFALIAASGKLQRLSEVEALEESRIVTGLDEFDRVLGGGIVPGSLVLLGGEPGIGKSTLLLQAAARLETAGRTVLYASGEESPDQIRLRADRLVEDAGSVHVLGETRLDAIVTAAGAVSADVVVIDSIQTV